MKKYPIYRDGENGEAGYWECPYCHNTFEYEDDCLNCCVDEEE